MSNTITGSIFGQIIERVVLASQNDFEESGVDQQTLQEMKEVGHGCCRHASFPFASCHGQRHAEPTRSRIPWQQ
ncbi:hypothetical protein IWX49DRAFT_578070 [Phyllosticta citricarpa]